MNRYGFPTAPLHQSDNINQPPEGTKLIDINMCARRDHGINRAESRYGFAPDINRYPAGI
jgi:hypothetical protein